MCRLTYQEMVGVTEITKHHLWVTIELGIETSITIKWSSDNVNIHTG